jgi:hypothetical protein
MILDWKTYKGSTYKTKIQPNPYATRPRHRPGTVDGTPSQLLPCTPWNERSTAQMGSHQTLELTRGPTSMAAAVIAQILRHKLPQILDSPDSAVPRNPARGRRAQELHRVASTGKVAGPQQSSKERRHRRGRPSPAKTTPAAPPPPRCRQLGP